jgi:hypothetical protein
MAAVIIVGAAIVALVYSARKKQKPVGAMCNKGHCNEKSAGTPDPTKQPIILDPPKSMCNINDIVEIGSVEPFGNTQQIEKIRRAVKSRKDADADQSDGVAIGSGALA